MLHSVHHSNETSHVGFFRQAVYTVAVNEICLRRDTLRRRAGLYHKKLRTVDSYYEFLVLFITDTLTDGVSGFLTLAL